MNFYLVSTSPSRIEALKAQGERLLPLEKEESMQALAQRIVRTVNARSTIVVDLDCDLAPGDGLELVEELVLWGVEKLQVIACSTLGLPEWGKVLSRLDADVPASRFYRRLAASGCHWEAAGFWNPLGAKSIEDALKELPAWWERSADALTRWRRLIAIDRLEAANRRIRHSLGHGDSVRGAARLVLGAVAHPSSYLTLEQGTSVLKELSPDHADELDGWFAQAHYSALLDLVTQGQTTPTVASEVSLRVLFLDDDTKAATAWNVGLRVLFESLHFEGRRLCKKVSMSYRLPDALMKDKAFREPDLILLDYDLSLQGQPIEPVMEHLKARWPFCPVIVFTQCDRVEVAEWCLANGASGFFVKEPSDERERRSDQHFARFADLFLSLDGLNGSYRGLWSRDHLVRKLCAEYQRLFPVISQWDDLLATQEPPRGSILHQTTTALQLLLGSGADLYLQSRSSVVEDATAGQTDLRRWAEVCTCLLRAEELLQAALWLYSGKPQPEGGAALLWYELRTQGVVKLPNGALNQLQDRGGWEGALGHSTGEKALANFAFSFDSHVCKILERTLQTWQIGAAAFPEPETAASELSLTVKPAPDPVRAVSRHDITARFGALELVESVLPAGMDRKLSDGPVEVLRRCIEAGELPPDLGDDGALRSKRVWLVDDQPDSSYAVCLRLLLEHCGAEVVPVEFTGNRLLFTSLGADPKSRPDIVLLDLNMPEHADGPASVAGGLAALRQLRTSVSRAVPVAVLTGSVDSLSLSQCLAAGAQDYIPKRTPEADPIVARKQLFERFAHLVRFAAWTQPLRRIWDDLEGPNSLEALESCLLEAQCEPWRREVAEAMRPWGMAPRDDEPGTALTGSLAAAETAWNSFFLACLSAAPRGYTLMQRPEAWLSRLILPQERRGNPAQPHLRRGVIALGNMFEAVAALVCSGVNPTARALETRTLGDLLWEVSSNRRKVGARLYGTPYASLSGSLRDWLATAHEARQLRNAWEHAQEDNAARKELGTPAQCAKLLSHCLEAACGFARIGCVVAR